MISKDAPSSSIKLGKTLLFVFIVSLSLRLFVFVLMSNQVEQSTLPQLIIDSHNYVTAADDIRENLRFNAHGIHIFGPGYPTFLAILRTITTAPRFITLIQILLSALGSLTLILFTWELTRDRIIAVLAGLMHATSKASIALSNLVMSDSVFFFILITALVLFIRGLRTDNWKFYLPASLLFGIAPLFRSIGLFFFGPLLITTIVLLWPSIGERWKEKRKQFLWPIISIIIALSFIGAWANRDRGPVDPPIAYSTYGGMCKVAALTRARINQIDYSEAAAELDEEIADLMPAYNNKLYGAYMAHSKAEFIRLFKSYPLTTTATILINAVDKSNNSKTQLWRCLPSYALPINRFEDMLGKYGLNYLVAVLSIIGLVMLLARKQYRLIIILSVIYVYFAILSGFTVNTGNRIFLPGQIAWTILSAYPILAIFNFLWNRVRKVRKVQSIRG